MVHEESKLGWIECASTTSFWTVENINRRNTVNIKPYTLNPKIYSLSPKLRYHMLLTQPQGGSAILQPLGKCRAQGQDPCPRELGNVRLATIGKLS